MKLVTCLNCTWVSFAVSTAQALAEIEQFNMYYDSLPESKQEQYYRNTKPTLADYTCLRCSGSIFRPAENSEVPAGSTINPVVYEIDSTKQEKK